MGSTTRSKKHFAAQQVVMLLGSLAHNVVVWARRWLAAPPASCSKLRYYGMLRLVRDAFHISGLLVIATGGQVVKIGLNQATPLASALVDPLQ